MLTVKLSKTLRLSYRTLTAALNLFCELRFDNKTVEKSDLTDWLLSDVNNRRAQPQTAQLSDYHAESGYLGVGLGR